MNEVNYSEQIMSFLRRELESLSNDSDSTNLAIMAGRLLALCVHAAHGAGCSEDTVRNSLQALIKIYYNQRPSN